MPFKSRHPRFATGVRPAYKPTDEDIAVIKRLRDCPQFFSECFFDRRVLPQQLQFTRSVEKNRLTAVRAAHGVGKSEGAAKIVAWFLWSNPRSKIVTTAPTWRQVKTILWAEINSLAAIASGRHVKLPSGAIIPRLGPEPNTTDWQFAADWFAQGISTKKIEAFQGIHAPRVLVVFDEASGISDEIFAAASSLAVGDNDRFLAIGNPTQDSGWFYHVFNNKERGKAWTKIHLDGEKMPWIMAGTPPPAPGLITQTYIDDMLRNYGREHPAYQIHVRGNFATVADDILLTYAQALSATEFEMQSSHNVTAMGVDVARYGRDKSVIAILHGDELVDLIKLPKCDTMQTANRIYAAYNQKRVDVIVIDTDGLGAGVFDRCNEMALPVVEFHGGLPAKDERAYADIRTEAMFDLTKELKRGQLKIMADEELLMQISYLPYKIDVKGRIKLIPKEELRSQGKDSPDCADSLMMGRWGQWQLALEEGGEDDIVVIEDGQQVGRL